MWNRKHKVALRNATVSSGNTGLKKVQLKFKFGRDTAANILTLQRNGMRFLESCGQDAVFYLISKEEQENSECISQALAGGHPPSSVPQL